MTSAEKLLAEIRLLVDDVSAMDEGEKSIMIEPLSKAVTAIVCGFSAIANAAAERKAGVLASAAVQKAAGSARAAPMTSAVDTAARVRVRTAQRGAHCSRPFRPELREDKFGGMAGVIRVTGIVNPSTLRDIHAEMLTFSERGKPDRKLLLDLSAASFDLDEDDWDDFSRRWLAAQPAHLGLGYVVAEAEAFEEFNGLVNIGVRRGRINLLWECRADAVDWLGF